MAPASGSWINANKPTCIAACKYDIAVRRFRREYQVGERQWRGIQSWFAMNETHLGRCRGSCPRQRRMAQGCGQLQRGRIKTRSRSSLTFLSVYRRIWYLMMLVLCHVCSLWNFLRPIFWHIEYCVMLAFLTVEGASCRWPNQREHLIMNKADSHG